jgi:hypothetical protein
MAMTVADFLDNYARSRGDGYGLDIRINGWYGDQRVIHYHRDAEDAARNSIPMILCEAEVDSVRASGRDAMVINVVVDW